MYWPLNCIAKNEKTIQYLLLSIQRYLFIVKVSLSRCIVSKMSKMNMATPCQYILAAILAMLSISEGGAISVVCRYWNRVLRDFVHRTMIRELNVPKTASDVMIRAIVARFQRLASLDLTDCDQVSDVGVQAIGAGCPSLTSLNLSGCDEVSDVGVQAIGAGCPSLTSLDLSAAAK